MKAKFIGASRDNRFGKGWEHTFLFYEYRGHEYMIIKDNNGCAGEGLAAQHKAEQEKIDREIEEASRPAKRWEYKGSGEEGFDFAMNCFESK